MSGTPLDLDVLGAERVVAIARASSARHAVRTAAALQAGGIRVIEFPLTTPGILDRLPDVRAEVGDEAWVGVGTVTSAADVRAAVDAGAELVVTPAVDLDVLAAATQVPVPVLCGAFTPTEVHVAWTHGATAVKLFPASIGGPVLVRELRGGPFPDVPLVPTGGVALEDGRAYLDAGALALGLASSLVGDAMETGRTDDLSGRVARLWRSLDLVAS